MKAFGTKKGDPWTRQYFDQIDYVLIPRRWRNGIHNAETDFQANIESDHVPIVIECSFQLKAIQRKKEDKKVRYLPLETNKEKEFNEELNRELGSSRKTEDAKN